ncbi:transposase-like protein [Streptomyces sp. LBL]|uniref:hypothetical protein n=1 Tax=Streptomyces sp. LBL TaxID=2940562 RepID=UPI002473CE0E|nr:hypothetical protein [Streptomyces sp. LBL]MDH6625944.1 transposase-like protein [Streptomyces sp. LBL]
MTDTGNPVPEVAEDLGINETTRASWVSRATRAKRTAPKDRDVLIAPLTTENARARSPR